MNPYRLRIRDILAGILAPLGSLPAALDFGAGDGWFAHALMSPGQQGRGQPIGAITAVDVVPRARQHHPVRIYDGERLPFADRAFDLVYSIDALHHCPSPEHSLKELTRTAGRYLLLKDHTCNGILGRLTLAILDEIGNRRFSIRSPYHYQRGQEWFTLIAEQGFVLEKLIHPAVCHTGPLGWATNGLQFIALWRRDEVLWRRDEASAAVPRPPAPDRHGQSSGGAERRDARMPPMKDNATP